MSRLIKFLVVLVVIVGALQWFIPHWAQDALASELTHYDHGPKPTVEITALPFWTLVSGRFQDVYVVANDAMIDGFSIRHVNINWRDGGLSLKALEKGHVEVTRAGHASMTIVLTGASLSRSLAHSGKISDAEVSIVPSGISIAGRLYLSGVYVPLDTKGSLVVSRNHRQLIFHPTSIDGIAIPVLTDVQLLNLQTMKLPMALVINDVRLGNDQASVTVSN